MSADLALFDLEAGPTVGPATISRPIARRPGHQIRAHNTPGRWTIACTCGDHSPVYTHPDSATTWAYKHLGIVYDTAIEQAVHA